MFERTAWAALLGGALCVAPVAARAQAAPEIVVTAATPLHVDTPDAQRATAKEIAASHALDLTEFLDRRLGSVSVNATQNNPLQPDINFRGFTASPLLGTPQGLSVYLDGVRQNQPFGDVVSWDLIPRDAIADVALIPGSDPLFGRNTLGAAIAIRTRDGRTDPGTTFEANYGSYDRWRLEAETGGSKGAIDWFATVNHFEDRGWRDFSASNADQMFAKLGWTQGATRLSIAGSFTDSDLNGNGLQEMRLLSQDYASVYTQPDNTRNRAYAFTLTGSHDFTPRLQLTANLYHRNIDTRTFNGDINDDALGESLYQPNAAERAALAAAGYSGFPTSGESQSNTAFPKWRCIANVLLNSEPNEKCNGLANRSATQQYGTGFSTELRSTAPLFGRGNALTIGGNWEADRAQFQQSTQFGYLTPDRGVVPVDGPGAFADGSQDSENAFDARVDLDGRTYGWSLFATDTIALGDGLQLAGSARYDRTIVDNQDALTPAGETGSLTGRHAFGRVNPAGTLVWAPDKALGLHVTLSQGSRAPSAIELGCSDPANPCRLPNALAGDPPLHEVVTRTIEAGAEGTLSGGKLHWSVTGFRADSHDDILFVTDDASGFGYFKNFGLTRRQGVELSLDARHGPIRLAAHYSFLDATYRSGETVNGSANSANDGPAPGFDGNIQIVPGDRIPLLPRHQLKLRVDADVLAKLKLGAEIQAQSGMVARGNENNLHQPDGVYYLGPGKAPGFAVANFDLEWRPTHGLKLYAQLNNAFDRHYYTAAQLSATGFDASGNYVARPFAGPVIDGERPLLYSTFYAPAAPRSVWIGAWIQFGRGS
jgi:outer membrane receptor protein involved in Fe transport